MSFPVTIDAALSSAEQPAKYGPYLIGSDRFEILLLVDSDPNAPSARLVAKKSSDGGLTWAEVDSANAPAITFSGSPALVPYACCQAGALIYVVFYDQSFGFLMVTFGPGWGTPAAVPFPPGGIRSGEGGFFLYQIAFAHSSFDSTLLLVVAGDKVTLDDVDHQISAFTRYNIGGASWGAWVDLGYVDYSDITTWDQVPCGLVVRASTGQAIVFMQQVARAGPGFPVQTQLTAGGPFSLSIPLDAGATADVKAWGAGGGGNPPMAGPSGVPGSGGGGGAFKAGTISITPGGTLNGTVGAAGLSGAAGGDSIVDTVTAQGGQPGVSGTSAPGGAGGTGDEDGGGGGDSGAGGFTGGGGGGSGTPTAPGDPGSPGGVVLGGAGGNGQGAGGQGGNDSPFNPPVQGQAGGNPGGGGGGHGVADLTPPFDANVGGDGEIDLVWISIRNTHDCRMFQQLIQPDNSLGTLTEITQGAYPARSRGGQPIPITFDAAIAGAQVSVTFTGATSTAGRNNIAVGRGTFADPISLGFQTFSCGNGANDRDSSPCLAVITGTVFCCYISAPTGAPVAFVYRADSGGGFGAPVALGSLSTGDVHAYSRLQTNALVGVPEITWGTPTIAFNERSHPV